MGINLYPEGYSETACWDCARPVTIANVAYSSGITGSQRAMCPDCGRKVLALQQLRASRRNSKILTALLVLVVGLAVFGWLA